MEAWRLAADRAGIGAGRYVTRGVVDVCVLLLVCHVQATLEQLAALAHKKGLSDDLTNLKVRWGPWRGHARPTAATDVFWGVRAGRAAGRVGEDNRRGSWLQGCVRGGGLCLYEVVLPTTAHGGLVLRGQRAGQRGSSGAPAARPVALAWHCVLHICRHMASAGPCFMPWLTGDPCGATESRPVGLTAVPACWW